MENQTATPAHRCPRCGRPLRQGVTWKVPSIRWVCDGQDCGYDVPLYNQKDEA